MLVFVFFFFQICTISGQIMPPVPIGQEKYRSLLVFVKFMQDVKCRVVVTCRGFQMLVYGEFQPTLPKKEVHASVYILARLVQNAPSSSFNPVLWLLCNCCSIWSCAIRNTSIVWLWANNGNGLVQLQESLHAPSLHTHHIHTLHLQVCHHSNKLKLYPPPHTQHHCPRILVVLHAMNGPLPTFMMIYFHI